MNAVKPTATPVVTDLSYESDVAEIDSIAQGDTLAKKQERGEGLDLSKSSADRAKEREKRATDRDIEYQQGVARNAIRSASAEGTLTSHQKNLKQK